MSTISELPETYEISAVARLTGISSHVLRVWERRYNVVEPLRTDSQRRRYSKEDVRRLTLIKMLVDNGNSISSIASLDTIQLEERLQEISNTVINAPNTLPLQSERKIAIAGNLLRDAAKEAIESDNALSMAGEFADLEELSASLKKGAVDLIALELSTLFPETVDELNKAIKKSGALRAVVVYQFSGREAIEALDCPNITAIRFPATSTELLEAFRADLMAAPDSEAPATSEIELKIPEVDELEIPERRYSDASLAKVARLSSVVKCECPQHLAGLLSNLGAFEKYSAECESRDEKDSEMHAYLHQATAQCRAEMEIALARVMEFEGIDIGN